MNIRECLFAGGGEAVSSAFNTEILMVDHSE